MQSSYVLVDFENVQPKNLEILSNHPFHVIVFVGANQSKVPLDLATAMQPLGENARYVQIQGNGKNALDFHIAFYIGELSSPEKEATFYIISRDTGFDPLIKHLKQRGMKISRAKDLAEIPELRMSSAKSTDEKLTAIVKNLAGRGQARPRKIKTLTNTINSLFTKQLEQAEIMNLIEELQTREYIVVNQGNVSYKLP